MKDCIAKAKYPQNLTFGVVDQNSKSQKNEIEE